MKNLVVGSMFLINIHIYIQSGWNFENTFTYDRSVTTGIFLTLVVKFYFKLLIHENIKHRNVNLAIIRKFTDGLPK